MKLLINESPLQVLPSLAAAIGLNEAMFLQQLHYWLNASPTFHDGRRWVFNSALEWKEQFPFWSEATIRRIIGSLKKQGLISTTDKYNKKRYDKTTWFTIDYEQVEKLELNPTQKPTSQFDQSVSKPTSQIDQMDLVKLTRPIPETTRDYKTPPPKKPATPRQQRSADPNHSWFVKWWCYAYQIRTGNEYAFSKKDAGQVKQLLNMLDLNELVARSCVYLMQPAEKRFPRGAPTLGGLQCQINEVVNYNEDIEKTFIAAGVLPCEEIPTLTDFTPWSRYHEQQQRLTA